MSKREVTVNNFWNKKNTELFIKYFNEGKEYREIKELIKCPNTIDSLKSKRARLGLQSRYSKITIPSNLCFKRNDVDIQKVKKNLIKKWGLNWKLTKHAKKSKVKKTFKSYLVIADLHIPFHNKEVIKIFIQLMKDIEFDGFIILGDMMDMTPISHWLYNQKKRKTLEGLRLKKDYIIGNLMLDEFDKNLPKDCDKRFFLGNHELWEEKLVEAQPALEGLFNPITELKLKERGYIVYERENHIERIGRLSFTHGIYTFINHVRKHIDSFKTNVLYAHLHTVRSRLEHSPAKEIAISGYTIGCGCDLNPYYMKNKPSAWSHGFAVVHFYEDGFFDVDNKRIVRGKVIYNNKFYDGNKL